MADHGLAARGPAANAGLVRLGRRALGPHAQPAGGTRAQHRGEPARVAQLRGDGRGGDIVVLSGTASIGSDAPSANADVAYLTKYDEHIARIGHTPESFANRYSEPVRIRLERLRGH